MWIIKIQSRNLLVLGLASVILHEKPLAVDLAWAQAVLPADIQNQTWGEPSLLSDLWTQVKGCVINGTFPDMSLKRSENHATYVGLDLAHFFNDTEIKKKEICEMIKIIMVPTDQLICDEKFAKITLGIQSA